MPGAVTIIEPFEKEYAGIWKEASTVLPLFSVTVLLALTPPEVVT